jgi:ABC-type nitrate/sulfonate/bicarbonate transport system permease component
VLVGVWEIAARITTRGLEHPEFVMPDVLYCLRHGVPGLADYYTGLFGGASGGDGATASATYGLLALLEHGGISLARVLAGLTIGVGVGLLASLAMAAFAPLREGAYGLANLMRMLPLLALGPLFTLWFGPSSLASIVFIAFAVGVTVIVGTLAAIANLDADLVSYARTLGASRRSVYLRVVLPAVVPELGGVLLVCAPLAWSVLLASELFGIQDGLGWMMGQALKFTLVDRITVIAAMFVVLTFVTVRLISLLVARATVWAE